MTKMNYIGLCESGGTGHINNENFKLYLFLEWIITKEEIALFAISKNMRLKKMHKYISCILFL